MSRWMMPLRSPHREASAISDQILISISIDRPALTMPERDTVEPVPYDVARPACSANFVNGADYGMVSADAPELRGEIFQ